MKGNERKGKGMGKKGRRKRIEKRGGVIGGSSEI